jgi:hypothetical protein
MQKIFYTYRVWLVLTLFLQPSLLNACVTDNQADEKDQQESTVSPAAAVHDLHQLANNFVTELIHGTCDKIIKTLKIIFCELSRDQLDNLAELIAPQITNQHITLFTQQTQKIESEILQFFNHNAEYRENAHYFFIILWILNPEAFVTKAAATRSEQTSPSALSTCADISQNHDLASLHYLSKQAQPKPTIADYNGHTLSYQNTAVYENLNEAMSDLAQRLALILEFDQWNDYEQVKIEIKKFKKSLDCVQKKKFSQILHCQVTPQLQAKIDNRRCNRAGQIKYRHYPTKDLDYQSSMCTASLSSYEYNGASTLANLDQISNKSLLHNTSADNKLSSTSDSTQTPQYVTITQTMSPQAIKVALIKKFNTALEEKTQHPSEQTLANLIGAYRKLPREKQIQFANKLLNVLLP